MDCIGGPLLCPMSPAPVMRTLMRENPVARACTRPARFDQSKARTWRGWGRGPRLSRNGNRRGGRISLPSKRGAPGPMLGVPFRTRPAHIMTLGAIAVAGAHEQPVPPRHEQIEAAEQRDE